MKKHTIATDSKTALVPGAAHGIGRCYAERLAAAGYRLILVDRDGGTLDTARQELAAAHGVTIDTLVMDMARMEASEELYAAVARLGAEVEVLVNNAGVFSYLDILATPVERIERMILLHDLTLSKNCRAFGADMARRGSGYILNMSSYSVWIPFPGMALYTATKAYVRCFSKAFAKEVAERGVRVTAVCPAGVATDLYGLSPKWQHIGRRLGVLISPDSCARRGLRALWRGRRCIVPDWWNRLFVPLYFHAVESRFVRRIHRTAEVGGHLSDFVAPHGAHGGVGIEVEARRCTDRNLSGRGVVRHVAAMADLDRCGGSFAVDGFGDVAQSRDDFGSQPQLFFERQPAATDGGVGQCGHSHAAAGDAHVVVFQLFGGAVGAAHRFECRRTDRAVAQRDGT